MPIRLPPLRERGEDIPALVQHFLVRARAEGLPTKAIEPDAMAGLKTYSWPGNVRELENMVRRLAVLYAQETIGAEVIEAELREAAPPALDGVELDHAFAAGRQHRLPPRPGVRAPRRPPAAAGLHGRILREVERPLIVRVLEATRGNQIKAAALLGVNRNTLRKKFASWTSRSCAGHDHRSVPND